MLIGDTGKIKIPKSKKYIYKQQSDGNHCAILWFSATSYQIACIVDSYETNYIVNWNLSPRYPDSRNALKLIFISSIRIKITESEPLITQIHSSSTS